MRGTVISFTLLLLTTACGGRSPVAPSPSPMPACVDNAGGRPISELRLLVGTNSNRPLSGIPVRLNRPVGLSFPCVIDRLTGTDGIVAFTVIRGEAYSFAVQHPIHGIHTTQPALVNVGLTQWSLSFPD